MEKICPHCNAPMHAQMVICIKCGRDSREAPAGQSPAPVRPGGPARANSGRRSLRTPVLALAGLVVLAGLVAGGLWAPGYIKARTVGKDHADFAAAQEADSHQAYQEYLLQHPAGLHAAEAQAAMDDDWAFKTAAGKDDLATYIEKFPKGRHVDEARTKLETVKATEQAALAKRQGEEKKKKAVAEHYAALRAKWGSSPAAEPAARPAAAEAPKEAGKGGGRDEIKVYVVPYTNTHSVSGKITNVNGTPSPGSPGKVRSFKALGCFFISKAKPYERIAGRYRVRATLKKGGQRAVQTATFEVTGKNHVRLSFRSPREKGYRRLRLKDYTELVVSEFGDFEVDSKERKVYVAPAGRH